MAGKSNKLKIKKLQINFTNRWLYTLIVFFSLIVIGVFVYAVAPNPGHDITQIAPPDVCSADQFLKWDGSAWTCEAITSTNGGTSLWSLSGSNIYYDDGDVIIYDNTNPTLMFGDAFGNSPKAGVQLQVADKFLDIGDYMSETDDIGVRFFTNDNERMRIDKDGDVGIGTTSPEYELDVSGDANADFFIGDGSMLMNLIVRVQGTEYYTCDSTIDGLLRYKSGSCYDVGVRSSSFNICMRTGDSSYNWYNIKTYTWTDDSCESPDCPPGQTYYECTGDYVDPGCYDSRPPGCFRFIRDI